MVRPASHSKRCVLLVLLLGLAACAAHGQTPDGTGDQGTLGAYQRGRALIEQALAALGGAEALQQSGGIVLEGEGTLDLSARLQGLHPDQPQPVSAEEMLVLDLAGNRVAYETHAKVNADADEWNRYVYDDEGRMLIVLRLNGEALWVEADADQKQRYRRMVPHVLLQDALAQHQTLRHLGRFGDSEAVSFTLPTGEAVTLLFDPESRLLRGFEYLLDLPIRGDTRVRWRFDAYRTVEGLGPYPSGYRIELEDDLLKEIRYTRIEAGHPRADLFTAPDGIDVSPPPEPTADAPASNEAPAPDPLPRVRTLADGVYLAISVRGGFHHLFVEFEDFVLVVDAPAGYHELQMVPAIDWAGDVTSGSVGRRLLDAVRATVPGKPVRYVVLTHHHGDHAGGIRPFIDAGATILASAATKPVVEAAAQNTFTLQPDSLTGRTVQPAIEVVTGERTISDGRRSVRILDVGENPHAEGMLVVYLPEDCILYQSDLFMPSSSGFPDAARLPVMTWFVDWLERSGLEPETIYAVHGAARVTEDQLLQIRALDSEQSF